MTTSTHLEKSKKDRMWSWSFPSQKECKVRPQLKYFDGRLLDDEELRIVHQARLPHFPSTFNWRFRGLLIVPQCSSSTIARRAFWMSVGPPRIKMWRPTDSGQHRRRRSSSFSHVDDFKVKGQKPFTFLVWWLWLKFFLVPGIHERGEGVGVDWK